MVASVSPRIIAAAVVALTLAASPPAFALGAIVTSPPGASAAATVREAITSAPGRTVRWGSVEVRGTASTVAWLVPVRPGAALDLASDAWLEALDAASAPRVVPPDLEPPCGISGGVEVEGEFTHTVTTSPGAVVVAPDEASLATALATSGLTLTSDLAPAVDAAFAAGSWMVALVYTQPPADLVTRTVRIVDTSPTGFSLSLVEAGSSPVAITAFAIGDASVTIGAQPPLTMDASAVVWRSDGTSSYGNVREALLAANPGGWLFETGGHGVVFDGLPVPGGNPTPALSTSYFFRAAGYGDATSSPDACTSAANALEPSEATVAMACPAGALAHAGDGPTCQEIVGGGDIDPSVFRCGGVADDLAMALSGLEPAQAWVTRVRSALAPATTGQDARVTGASAAGPYGPVVTASAYAEPCDSQPGDTPADSSGSGGGGSEGAGSGGYGGSGGGSPGSPSGTGEDEPGGGGGGVIVGAAAVGNVASSASDSCGGDSSDSGDSCSGDSSSSSDSGGCDGSTDDSGCSVGPQRRSPTSRLGLVLVAVAAFARRRARRRRG
jgi:MYXO-CTERM domain-containing protein